MRFERLVQEGLSLGFLSYLDKSLAVRAVYKWVDYNKLIVSHAESCTTWECFNILQITPQRAAYNYGFCHGGLSCLRAMQYNWLTTPGEYCSSNQELYSPLLVALDNKPREFI